MRTSITQSLLQPFLHHSAPIRSIVTQYTPPQSGGRDLLLLPAEQLTAIMPPPAAGFGFEAVAALLPSTPGPLLGENAWKLRRGLFDHGLICIGSAQVADSQALCFLASAAIQSLDHLHGAPRGHIAISTLAHNGRFANQLFRYAGVKLYALRHGLTPAFPEWEGRRLFGLNDNSSAGLDLPMIEFHGFTNGERLLWEAEDPPIDLDINAYFQEIPECWRRHRPLLRRLFQLPPEHTSALDAWRGAITAGGRRTLVAIHIRRGDYLDLQLPGAPWFRIVPEAWYLDWLRTVWPSLREPILFVATDDPATIKPVFQEFETIPDPAASISTPLPGHVLDFEILRRADHLAICNSSFSRMAAILAPPTQHCFIPNFQTQSFEPYEPWIDPAFWARFEGATRTAPAARPHKPQQPPTTLLDVSDLLFYLLHHTTLSGIQRVQCEILRNLLDIPLPQPVRLVVLNNRGQLGAIETSTLLDIIEDLRSDAMSRTRIEARVGALLKCVVPCPVQSGDVFLTIGAFWTVQGTGLLLQKLKNSGVMIGVFIHDIIPITAPEYFESGAARVFVKGVAEALTFASFILTTSEFNKASLAGHMASRQLDPLPIHLVPLGHALPPLAPAGSNVSSAVAGILDTRYVLCVGTIEVRKNPAYLFNLWKLMLASSRPDIPSLVFAGRKGWLVQDFMDQLKACNYLGGRIRVVHNVTDVELDLLYRNCVLTMFPSFIEGWGLPVGESLAHGKICLCSALGGIPEVGGGFVDYIDPYNPHDGLQQLLRYLDSPDLRLRREVEIAAGFEPRSWRTAAEGLLRSAQVLARQVRPFEGVAAIVLPPNRYLPVGSGAAPSLTGEAGGALSAELICISGWRPPEVSGVRAAQPATLVRFRADAPAGTRINLTFRLAAHGRDFRIRVRSGSGAETEVSLAQGAGGLAVLSCEVEPGGLVSAHLWTVGAPAGHDGSTSAYWMLEGVLYFDPKRLPAAALEKFKSAHKAPSAATVRVSPTDRPEPPSPSAPLALRSAVMDESRRAASFGAFLQSADSYWPSDFTGDRDAPIFAGRADKLAFYSGCGKIAEAPRVGSVGDAIQLVRRSDQFVSMSRFSEGSVFDRSGVWKGFGYLKGSPPGMAPWLSSAQDSVSIGEQSLAAAPYYDRSYFIFYNGNLHNYYHWLVEGLLPLDILSRALGPDSNLKIVLPKSMDINAVFDHRQSLQAIGLGARDIVEAAENLIKVREAIWVDSDLIQTMPAPYLKDFQQRIAAQYAGLRTPRNRRLLIARKGPTRKIHNLDQVEALLSRYNFETVYLEGMSVADQILLFHSAEFIVGPHGAGLSNLLFCEPGTKVIELAPSYELRPFFWLISEKLDLVHGLQFCPTVEGHDFQSAIAVDVDKLQALIHMVGAHR